MEGEIAIAVRDLRVDRGGRSVLDDVSIAVPAANVTGLLGPSGSGKTTLMRAIVGVQRIASGSVTVLGLPAGSAELRPRVAYMTQAPSVYGDITVRENLRYFARILDASDGATEAALDAVGLEALQHEVVNRLSGGERARVSLASALLGRPDVLVLDEPTVGLDPVLRRDLWATFHRIAREGAALLVSSHVMEEAANCDELLLIRAGRVVAAATPAELRRRTATDDLSEAFLRLVEDDEEPKP
jgi:ABC-2 type transport system ATP-binding protein